MKRNPNRGLPMRLLWLPIALLACAHPPDPTPPGRAEHPVGPVVTTTSGPVRGESTAGRGAVFRGIPYARPPTGDLRWRPPVPPRPWSGVRDATVSGPPCPQGTGTTDYYRRVSRRLGTDPDAVRGLGPGSEDCLSLNVWTPSLTPPVPAAVLVWVHGGGGVTGSGSDPLFRGEDLAREGLVVVTLNYRLGALGFLAHPALSAESPRRLSGNYGLRDLIRALTWVRDNIGAFGGDPGRVTLAGQSAGANLVETLMVSPPARGLFQRAISHSATALDARPLRGESGERTAEGAGRAFAKRLGLDTTATAAELRRIPVDSLVVAAAEAGPDAPSGVVVDGVVLPDAPGRLWARGAVAPVPLLKGSNSDEFALFMPPTPIPAAEYRAWVRGRYGEAAGTALRALPPDPDPNVTHRQRVRLLSDDAFGVPMLQLLRWADGRLPVWLYRFTWHQGDGDVGAFHSAEIPFLFDTHEAVGWWTPDPGARQLTRAIQAAWARFAATGAPGAARLLPPWPRATAPHPLVMILDEDPEVRSLPRADLLRRLADGQPPDGGRQRERR